MAITCGKRKLSSTLFGDTKRPKTCEDGNEKGCCVLLKDVMDLIFQRLSFSDLARAKLVCSYWLSVSRYVENLQVPLLLVPHENNLCLLNLEEKKSFIVKDNVGFDFYGDSSYVVGSSHGCVIYLDEDLLPVVLNPWTGTRIQLPQLLSDRCIVVKKNVNGVYISKKYLGTHSDVLEQHWLREHIVHKVILSSNPFNGGKKFSVALIYGPDSELAYFNVEDHSWTRLDQEKNRYSDIIFHENKLYAVEGLTNNVEVWDFCGIHPRKLTKLNLSNPTKSCNDDYNFFGCSDGWKYYLVESRGKILLIARQIADNVDENGNVVFDPDSVPNETNHPLIFPYGTIAFSVLELDMLKKQWTEVKSLDGFALFLGGNHSVSISVQQDFVKCKENSIYFSDDNWERMDEDNTYGGHDMGVFDMSVGKVTMFDQFSRDRIQPSPCWIIPKLW